MDKPDLPRLTPVPDDARADEPIADILERGDAESTAESAAHDRGPPLTESQRVKHEGLSDLIPSMSPEPPEDDGQVTPPIAP